MDSQIGQPDVPAAVGRAAEDTSAAARPAGSPGPIQSGVTLARGPRSGFGERRVAWQKPLHARDDVAELAELADEDPLVNAADRYATLKKFAPVFLEALDFKAARRDDQIAVKLLRDVHKAGKRDVPADAPMPFKKEWRSLIHNDGRPDRRLYETAVLAHLRNKLRSGDIWVERSSVTGALTVIFCHPARRRR